MYGIGYSLFNTATFLNSRGGVALDPDAQAFVTAASITDATQITAVNTLVTDLKTASIWTKLDVILPILGGSAAAHRVDLKTATNKVTWFGGITHDSTGVLFNGSTGYGNVDWAAPNTYNRTAAEWSKYYYSLNTNWSGSFDGANVFGMQCQIVSPVLQRTISVGLNNLQTIDIDSAWGLRTSIIEGSGANQGRHYANSTLLYQSTPNATPTGLNYFIGALNISGSAGLYNQRQQQFFAFGNALDATDVLNLSAAVNTYQTTLGR